LGWMVHATHETHTDGRAAGIALANRPRNLHEWEYGPCHDRVSTALRRRAGKPRDQWLKNPHDMLLQPMSDGGGMETADLSSGINTMADLPSGVETKADMSSGPQSRG